MSVSTLYKLCKALCISSDYLIFGNQNNEPDISDIINAIPDDKQKYAKELLSVFADALDS